MSEFTPKPDRLGQVISHANDMYHALHDAANALRCAGVGDTRHAMTQAIAIDKLLARIDGKEDRNETQ